MSYEYSDSYDWEELIDTLNNQVSKISDLEAKLAESEETINNLEQQCLICNKDKENEQLKQQLFESGLKTLEEIKLSEQRKKMLEDLSTKNWELEQQIAEKEKEIETLKKCGDTEHFYGLLEDKRKENKILIKAIEQANQDKISFAVEQINELRKEFAKRYVGYNWDDNIMVAKCCMMINDVFDNQLAELTHQHEDKGE